MRIFVIETETAGKTLHAALDKLDAVAVKDGMTIEEFELANHLAKRAFENRTNIARIYRYEFLLWLSGKRDIKSAMKETEPSEIRFVVAVFSDSGEKEVLSALGAKRVENKIISKAEPLALERISLSRVKN